MICIDHLANLSHISADDAERDPAPLSFERPRMSRATAELLEMIEQRISRREWKRRKKEREQGQ